MVDLIDIDKSHNKMFDSILSLMLMWILCGMYHCVAGITFRFIMQSLCNTVAIALLESVIHNNRFLTIAQYADLETKWSLGKILHQQ